MPAGKHDEICYNYLGHNQCSIGFLFTINLPTKLIKNSYATKNTATFSNYGYSLNSGYSLNGYSLNSGFSLYGYSLNSGYIL